MCQDYGLLHRKLSGWFLSSISRFFKSNKWSSSVKLVLLLVVVDIIFNRPQRFLKQSNLYNNSDSSEAHSVSLFIVPEHFVDTPKVGAGAVDDDD